MKMGKRNLVGSVENIVEKYLFVSLFHHLFWRAFLQFTKYVHQCFINEYSPTNIDIDFIIDN